MDLNNDIRRTDRRLVRKGVLCNYYEDTVAFASGQKAKWDYIDFYGAAGVVAVRPDGKILFVRQFRACVDKISLELPAGGRNTPDEPFEETAARELREETGYEAGQLIYLTTVHTAPAYTNDRMALYLAKDLHGPYGQCLDSGEYLHIEAYTPEEALRMVRDGEIWCATTVCGILLAREYL